MPFFEPRFEQNKNEITTILINEVMRKKQVKKSYSAPECTIIQVNEATYLMDTSFPGQHKPANHATGPTAAGGAKPAPAWQGEEAGSDEENTSWED